MQIIFLHIYLDYTFSFIFILYPTRTPPLTIHTIFTL